MAAPETAHHTGHRVEHPCGQDPGVEGQGGGMEGAWPQPDWEGDAHQQVEVGEDELSPLLAVEEGGKGGDSSFRICLIVFVFVSGVFVLG